MNLAQCKENIYVTKNQFNLTDLDKITALDKICLTYNDQ